MTEGMTMVMITADGDDDNYVTKKLYIVVIHFRTF